MNDSKMREPVGGPSWPEERKLYGSYTADSDEACQITTDGWCATHSTGEGPKYCEREAAEPGVEWTTR